MILSKIFTSFTFRFLVSYVAWLSISVFLVLTLIYAFIAYGFFNDVHGESGDGCPQRGVPARWRGGSG